MVIKTQIRTLKIRGKGAGGDQLVSKMRIADILYDAQLMPHGLSSYAILCIRRLSDPLPGRLSFHFRSMRPQVEWKRAIAASIDKIVSKAVRPVREMVPINAEAVIFTDRAEMLACLATDWYKGTVSSRWWWRSLFGGSDLTEYVKSAFSESPEYIPSALNILSQKRMVQKFVRSFSDVETEFLLKKIINTFALYDYRKLPNDKNSLNSENNMNCVSYGESPWSYWVPESDGEGLTIGQKCLLGIGLMLHHAPVVLRSSSFAESVFNWQQELMNSNEEINQNGVLENYGFPAEDAKPRPHLNPLPEGEEISLSFKRGIRAYHQREIKIPLNPPFSKGEGYNPLSPFIKGENNTPPHPATLPQGEVGLKIPPPLTESKRTPPPLMGGGQGEGELWRFLGKAPASPCLSPTRREDNQVQSSNAISPTSVMSEGEVVIETEFAGLFYLINLGIYLGLYGDFTSPLKQGIRLPIWDFIALIGERFIGNIVRLDPVWSLLSGLAGRRDDDPPGKGFTPSNEWRIPKEWLSAFCDDTPMKQCPQMATKIPSPLTGEGQGNVKVEPVKDIEGNLWK